MRRKTRGQHGDVSSDIARLRDVEYNTPGRLTLRVPGRGHINPINTVIVFIYYYVDLYMSVCVIRTPHSPPTLLLSAFPPDKQTRKKRRRRGNMSPYTRSLLQNTHFIHCLYSAGHTSTPCMVTSANHTYIQGTNSHYRGGLYRWSIGITGGHTR